MWITLNRPKAYNALNLAQWREITAALRDAESDPAIRVVVLPGAGGNFSAGYDLTAAMGELGGDAPDDWRNYVTVGNETCWTVWRLKKPVIAAVRGYCLGGAFELAMACDFVLASEGAKFGEPEIRFSDVPPFLISPWVMGMRQAKDLLLTGEIVVAIVVPTGPERDETAIIAFCRERLASYKSPERVIFRDALPYIAAGKVMRHELLESLG